MTSNWNVVGSIPARGSQIFSENLHRVLIIYLIISVEVKVKIMTPKNIRDKRSVHVQKIK